MNSRVLKYARHFVFALEYTHTSVVFFQAGESLQKLVADFLDSPLHNGMQTKVRIEKEWQKYFAPLYLKFVALSFHSNC